AVEEKSPRAALAGVHLELRDRLREQFLHRKSVHLVSDVEGVEIDDFAGELCHASGGGLADRAGGGGGHRRLAAIVTSDRPFGHGRLSAAATACYKEREPELAASCINLQSF